jgi:RNA polymerase sigma factor (sigma-70 family)
VNAAGARMILGCVQRAARQAGGLTDGELLGRYLARRDGGAFEALVRRHGPMVLAVCRRILRHAQDAEDAFQAAFVVLARKAASIRDGRALAAWLYHVAYHAAVDARAARLRRQSRERQVEDMPHPAVTPEDSNAELLALLDRELARLPETYRLPVVLCELEGRSRKDAARQLGLAEGTLSSRLAHARKTLARRMAAHGAALTAAALAGLLVEGARAACVPGALVVSTGRAAHGVVPAGVAALVQGVIKAMLLTKLKSVGWGLLLAASLAAGAVALTYRPATAQPAPDPRPPAGRAPSDAAPARAAGLDRDDLEALRLEVEALRLELKAAKERIKALEDRAHGPAGRPGEDSNNPGNLAPRDTEHVRPGGLDNAAPDRAINVEAEPLIKDGADRVVRDKEDPAADLEEVVKKLAR